MTLRRYLINHINSSTLIASARARARPARAARTPHAPHIYANNSALPHTHTRMRTDNNGLSHKDCPTCTDMQTDNNTKARHMPGNPRPIHADNAMRHLSISAASLRGPPMAESSRARPCSVITRPPCCTTTQKQCRDPFIARSNVFGEGVTPWVAFQARSVAMQRGCRRRLNHSWRSKMVTWWASRNKCPPHGEKEGLVGPTGDELAHART